MARVFISVGSNVDPEKNIRHGLCALGRAVQIINVSPFYLTEPVGRDGQPLFYNGVVEIETDLPPQKLKYAVLRKIERELGRQRSEDKYAPRTLDLDILLYDHLIVRNEALDVPDPEIARRSFLAIPLCELDPDLVLPDTGQPIREIARQLPHDMRPLPEYSVQLRRECLHEQSAR